MNAIEYRFNNKKYLVRALTTEDYATKERQGRRKCKSQNTLSTLGDALLRAILVEQLMPRYDTSGDISKEKATLEKNKMLPKIAKPWNLIKYIKKTQGEVNNLTKKSDKEMEQAEDTMLANTFEAIIGAIYLDKKSFEETRNVVNTWYNKLTKNTLS